MGAYLLRRLITMPLVLVVLVSASFFLMVNAPGGPFSAERNLPEKVEEALQEKYGFDQPQFVQLGRYMGRAIQGDLGPSIKNPGRDVNQIIADHIGPTLVIGYCAIVLSLALGILAGVLGAIRQNGWIDHASMSVAMFGMSVPRFVTGPVLVLIFALTWDVLPVSGYEATAHWLAGVAVIALFLGWRVWEWSRTAYPFTPEFDGGREAGAAWLGSITAAALFAVYLMATNETLILPSITLALPFASRIARLMRAGMLEIVHQDYIRTAYAKGLRERSVVLRHALKGGILPVVSYLGPAIAALLTGGLVVEQIFNVPGIAREFVESSFNRDYWLALGTVVLYGTVLVLFNLVVDIVYGFLDPRIRYD